MEYGHNRNSDPPDFFDPVLTNPIMETKMHITDLDECLFELPEINVREMFRPRNPASGPFSWSQEQAADSAGYSEPTRPQAA